MIAGIASPARQEAPSCTHVGDAGTSADRATVRIALSRCIELA
jgi:hypothetical protein